MHWRWHLPFARDSGNEQRPGTLPIRPGASFLQTFESIRHFTSTGVAGRTIEEILNLTNDPFDGLGSGERCMLEDEPQLTQARFRFRPAHRPCVTISHEQTGLFPNTLLEIKSLSRQAERIAESKELSVKVQRSKARVPEAGVEPARGFLPSGF